MRASFLLLVLLLAACGGSSSSAPTLPATLPPAPAAPSVNVDVGIKQLIFSWADVPNATHYILFENPDGHSGYTQTGEDIPAGTLSATKHIAVHLHDWVNALYMVQACNSSGCTGSTAVSVTDQMLDAIGYFKASNTESSDRFGSSVTISGDGRTIAVSANGEDSRATGINGNQSDNEASNSGAAYVFRFDGSVWYQEAYIKASNTDESDFFTSLALSSDGNTLVVGAAWEQSNATGVNGDQSDNSADRSGAVYVFQFDGATWAQEAYIKASNTDTNDGFGGSVALSGDGRTLVVGAWYEQSTASGIDGDQSDNSWFQVGAVYVFRFDGAEWVQEAYIKASNSAMAVRFGSAVRLSADGNTLAVGTWSEAVYVYRHDGAKWEQEARVIASNMGSEDRFGTSLDVSADGDTLVVGARLEDSNATGIDGDQDLNESQWEEHDAGAVYLFRFDAGDWIQEAYIKASNSDFDDKFGGSVRLSADGNTLAVGATAEGSSSLGVDGDQYARPGDGSGGGAGAVYIFRFDASDWSQHAYVKASNLVGGFGGSLGLSAVGSTLVVGAVRDDSNATGVGGDQSDDSSKLAGAAYVY